MESKNVACLEISSSSAKFAIGTFIGGEPVLIYYDEKPLRGALQDGLIRDPARVKEAIAPFAKVADESLRVKVNTSLLSLIVPPMGLKVYQSNKTTNVVAPTGLIDRIDITNVMSLVQKDPIPSGNVTVDIIPDEFQIDGGKRYANPPIGEKSNTLTVYSKIHTLPETVLRLFRVVSEDAGFRLSRVSVAPYAASQLLLCDKSLPHDYVLVDLGAHLTSVSLIGANSLFASLSFPKGGDDLSEYISSAFSLSFEEANRIKESFGYDTRKTAFNRPLSFSVDEKGHKELVYQKDLNNAIASFFETYNPLLNNALSQVIEHQGEPSASSLFSSLPIIFIGGGSLLFGIKTLLSKPLGNHPSTFYVPSVVGARDPRLINLLGLIVTEGQYKGSLEDNYHGVGGLSRYH